MSLTAHFEALYRQHPDPWRVAQAWYERRKRALLLAALPREHYLHVFEAGCGNGELSLALAGRCRRLLAVDASPSAAALCRRRVAGHAGVEVLHRRLPAQWPVQALRASGRGCDLLVVSELAYYLEDDEVTAFIDACLATLADDGDLLFCHYLPAFADRRQATDALHARVDAEPELRHLAGYRDADFRLDIWRRGVVA